MLESYGTDKNSSSNFRRGIILLKMKVLCVVTDLFCTHLIFLPSFTKQSLNHGMDMNFIENNTQSGTIPLKNENRTVDGVTFVPSFEKISSTVLFPLVLTLVKLNKLRCNFQPIRLQMYLIQVAE